MSRQRPDPLEQASALPLFDRPLTQLYTADDPGTSRAAAAESLASGAMTRARRLALAWVRRHPEKTARELGLHAYAFYGVADPETWRQRIGRRLNELLAAGLIHREGIRGGCACWWPGPGVRAETS